MQLAVQSMLVNGIYTILLTWPISPINSFGRDFWGLYKSILKSGAFMAIDRIITYSVSDPYFYRGATCCLPLESIGI